MAHGSRTHCLDRSMYTPNPVKLQARKREFVEKEKNRKTAVTEERSSREKSPRFQDPIRKGNPWPF